MNYRDRWLGLLTETEIQANTECSWSNRKCHGKILESITRNTNAQLRPIQSDPRHAPSENDRCIIAVYGRVNVLDKIKQFAMMQEKTTNRRGRICPPRCTTVRAARRIVCIAIQNNAATSRTLEQPIHSVRNHSEYACTILRHLE
ncbi:hypothetical protein TNCV_3326791 [Trichonephila clavipes]|nr:hypothetical protein TNCV_3326791 [Trichonephila clavipes]